MYVESKGLTTAVLNTSKMFEDIGDLYAKQVNIVVIDSPSDVHYIVFLCSLSSLCCDTPVLTLMLFCYTEPVNLALDEFRGRCLVSVNMTITTITTILRFSGFCPGQPS